MPATLTHLSFARDMQGSLDLRSEAGLIGVPAWIGLIVAVAILLLAAGPHVNRPGFSSDEEITALTVRGVATTGFPVLPSGILYLRGVPYAYSAWLAGRVLGQGLPAYRVVSLLFAILAVLLLFGVARQVTTTTAAVWAALLLASYQPHIAAAVFARFYSAFVAASLCAIWLFQPSQTTRRNDWAFLTALGVCRLMHEFAVILALLPLCQAVCAQPAEPRRRCFWLFLKCVVLLGLIQIVLTGFEGLSIATHLGMTNLRLGFFGSVPLAPPPLPVHRLAGPAALVLIAAWHLLAGVVARRITHAPWPAIVAYGMCAFLFQMGALLMVGVVAILSQPRQAVRTLLAGGMLAASGAAAWIFYTATATDAQFSLRLAYQLVLSTIWYPWEGLVHLGETLTLATLAAAVAATALMFRRAQSPKDDGLRVLALFSVITLAVLGLSGVELQWRYVLLASPPVLLLSAHFIESAGQWLVRRMPLESSLLTRRAAAAMVSVALVIAFIGDQYLSLLRANDSLPAASRASIFAPPTDTRWRADLFLANVEPGDRVICNDELACLFLAGRVDDWLLPAERIVDRYTAAGVEGRRGFYAGANVVATGSALERIIECGGRAVALVVLDTGKFDYLETRALALQMAMKFHGNVAAAGGEHLIVRISDARVTRACEGGES